MVLNDLGREVLGRSEAYRRPGSDFVFPADNQQGPVSWAQRSWERAKRRVGIDPKVRLHDLRHSVGSLLGHIYSEAVVAKMLGHLDSRTTRKHYINFNNEQLREAADAVSRRIGQAADEAARPAESSRPPSRRGMGAASTRCSPQEGSPHPQSNVFGKVFRQ